MAAFLGQIRNGMHLAPQSLSSLHLATNLENLAQDRLSSPFALLAESDATQVRAKRAMLICTRFRPYFCTSLSVSKFEGSATNPANPRRPIWRPEVPRSCSVDYNGVMLRSVSAATYDVC